MQIIKRDAGLGNQIRTLRKAAGLTQEQTAAKLQLRGFDISRVVYAQIECGTRNIRIEELVALKQIFGASYEDFFVGFENE